LEKVTGLMEYSHLLEPIKTLHREIRDRVLEACEDQSVEQLSKVSAEQGGDTIFQIDRVSEQALIQGLEESVGTEIPLILIAEGLADDGQLVLPRGTDPTEAQIQVIVDPIDGTRGLMYQKRSAWILTGVAINRGSHTDLSDIQLAVQTEIPLIKQHLSDTFWAEKGRGAFGERWNRLTGETRSLALQPSRETHLEQGFVTMARYFPGAQQILGKLYDTWIEQACGPGSPGLARCFEDQYISTAGHFAELLLGHDRVVVDVRPLVDGPTRGLCSHPYDVCTELIAREAGIQITDPEGNLLKAPLDVFTDVAWVGVANEALYHRVMPSLMQALLSLLPSGS
jgi:hypothetical protein